MVVKRSALATAQPQACQPPNLLGLLIDNKLHPDCFSGVFIAGGDRDPFDGRVPIGVARLHESSSHGSQRASDDLSA